jgi:hypothetical protein
VLQYGQERDCLPGHSVFSVTPLRVRIFDRGILRFSDRNAAADSQVGFPADLTFEIVDSSGAPVVVNNTKAEPSDINWFLFHVSGGVGACCWGDGSCGDFWTEEECVYYGGTYAGDGTGCDPNPCPQPAMLTAADAELYDYFGWSVALAGDLAVIGSRCDSHAGGHDAASAYTFVRSADPGAPGWSQRARLTAADASPYRYFGDSVTLDRDTAVISAPGGLGAAYVFELDCVGACCLGDGTCQLATSAECTLLDGAYQGDATNCAPDLCPQPGACCFHDGHCEHLLQAACTQAGGIEWTLDAACDPNPCPQPTGSCCLADGSCVVNLQVECTGAWTMFGICEPNPCPYVKGDVNCDHAVDTADIPYFVAALIGGYTGCDISLADMDSSNTQDGLDIQMLINILLPPP